MQYRFTEECSPAICAQMITEAIAEAKNLDNPVNCLFLDFAKAVGMADHRGLLNTLDLDPHLWHLYYNM